jgi:hypothetical protein
MGRGAPRAQSALTVSLSLSLSPSLLGHRLPSARALHAPNPMGRSTDKNTVGEDTSKQLAAAVKTNEEPSRKQAGTHTRESVCMYVCMCVYLYVHGSEGFACTLPDASSLCGACLSQRRPSGSRRWRVRRWPRSCGTAHARPCAKSKSRSRRPLVPKAVAQRWRNRRRFGGIGLKRSVSRVCLCGE